MALDGWLDIGGAPGCSSGVAGGPTTTGFTITQLWAAKTDVMTLCQGYFATWNDHQANGGTLKDVCAIAYNSGKRIQEVIDEDRLAVTVLHELTHSVSAVKTSVTDPIHFNDVSPVCKSAAVVSPVGW